MKSINILFCVMLLLVPKIAFTQGINSERTALTNYLKRMYTTSPFEGVKVIEDYNNCYLISVVTIDNEAYNNQYALNRVASTKAMSQANRYINGSAIDSETIIRTRTDKKGISDTEIIEDIKEHSMGYVKELELLTSFSAKDGTTTFVFSKPLNINNKKRRK